jgi:hypothetical protein
MRAYIVHEFETGESQLRWDPAKNFPSEEEFLVGSSVAIGSVKHLGEQENKELLVLRAPSRSVIMPIKPHQNRSIVQ